MNPCLAAPGYPFAPVCMCVSALLGSVPRPSLVHLGASTACRVPGCALYAVAQVQLSAEPEWRAHRRPPAPTSSLGALGVCSGRGTAPILQQLHGLDWSGKSAGVSASSILKGIHEGEGSMAAGQLRLWLG